MLGIAWRSDPLPANHTAPGCMLRFDVRDGGSESSVTVNFTYADVTSPDPVAVSSGTAFFTDSHSASKVGTDVLIAREQRARRSRDNSCAPQPLSSFADNARAQLYMPCVRLD